MLAPSATLGGTPELIDAEVMGLCSSLNARRQAICEIVLVATTPYGFTDIRMRSVNLPGERETLTVGELKRSGLFIPVDAG